MLEGRRLLSANPTYVANNWALVNDLDGSNSLSVGDVVSNASFGTLQYGFDAFGTVASGAFTGTAPGAATIQDAIAGVTNPGSVNILSGDYAGPASTAGKAVNLSPGSSPGQVTINGNLTLNGGSTFSVEIAGTSAATGYDNFVLTGGGAVTLSNANLNVSLLSFTPTAGNTFKIIDGANPHTGTFNGLPQGKVFAVGGALFQIDYTADGGNDVVLTALDTTQTYVDVTASPAAVAEDASGHLVYTFTRFSPSLSTPLTVNFNVSGSAVFASDFGQTGAATFSTSSGSVTIPSGSGSATVTVNPFVDTAVEADETVSLTVAAGVGYTSTPATSLATTTITNDDSAILTLSSVSAANAEGNSGATPFTFNVTLNRAVQGGLTVAYTTNDGTATAAQNDYIDNDGTLTFAGTTGETKTITVLVNGDITVEPDETFTVALGAISGLAAGVPGGTGTITTAGSPQTGTIINDDTATVSVAPTINGSEAGPVNGVFTVTQTKPSLIDTVLTYSVGGSATAGSDYTALNGTVTVPAGATTATIIVPVIDDSVLEPTESVTVTLTGITSGSSGVTLDPVIANRSASLSIFDNDAATVSIAGTNNATETGSSSGLFTVTQTKTSPVDTVISYTIGGTATAGSDYTALSGVVTIPSGTTSATISVPVIDDVLVEGAENVTVTLSTIISGDPSVSLDPLLANRTASLNIIDNDVATVSVASTTNGNEAGPVSGLFTVTQTKASSVDTVISYIVGGTATSGIDYSVLSGSVTIPAGATTAAIAVPVIDDNVVEPTETVTVTLTAMTAGNAGVTLDSTAANLTASLNIVDNDSATVSITAGSDGSESGPTNVTFTVAQSAVSASDTVIAFTLGGTATAGADYSSVPLTVTIPAGSSAPVIIPLNVIDDSLVEGPETVVITLTSIVSGDPDITLNANSAFLAQLRTLPITIPPRPSI